MNRVFLAIALFLPSFIAAADKPVSTGADVPPRLADAIARALADNPEIASMEARVEAARRRVPQATALPNPEVEVGIKDVPPSDLSLSRDDFTMEMVAARQRLPGFGKLSAEKRAAEAEFEGMLAEHERHVVEIAAEVADSFFRLAELDRRIAIIDETRGHLSDAVVSARERYGVGKGAQADVLRAGLEKTALEDRLASLEAERRSETARFNALQNLPAAAEVAPIEVEVDFVKRIATRIVPTASDLVERAERESPALAAARAEVRRAEERVEQARLERRPDWMLSGYYARREKFEDLAGLSVSFDLPWVHPRRLEERLAERHAELEGARANLAAARNMLRRDIDQAWAELARNREQARLYRDSILPQAEVNYRAAREAYAVGSIDFFTYVRAATDLNMYEAEAAEREMGIGRAVAALQKASSIPLIAGTPAGVQVHAKE